jgi:hypothetical protein
MMTPRPRSGAVDAHDNATELRCVVSPGFNTRTESFDGRAASLGCGNR